MITKDFLQVFEQFKFYNLYFQTTNINRSLHMENEIYCEIR